MTKILLHICCAPDAVYAAPQLAKENEVLAFFYNPNIHPEKEYQRRLAAMEQVAKAYRLKLIAGKYDATVWYREVQGLENEPEGGRRCEVCIRMRLKESARLARESGFDTFTTVLTNSPRKDAKLVNRLGKEIAFDLGVDFMEADFKKKDGFKKSVELSKKLGIYRQNFCGCAYSQFYRHRGAHLNWLKRRYPEQYALLFSPPTNGATPK